MKKSVGFTLIELLVAISIMGILSLLGVGQYRVTQKKARDFNRKAGLQAVRKALETYMTDKGEYPPSSTDGKILWCGTNETPVSCEWGGSFVDIAGSDAQTVYVAQLPKDTVESQTYFYEALDLNGSGMYTGYRLYARLENTQDPDITAYGPNCSIKPSVSLPCNFVLTSESVAPLSSPPTGTPTPSTITTPTPTPDKTPSSTSTPTPTDIFAPPPTFTPTPTGTTCLEDGLPCGTEVPEACCGTCLIDFVEKDGTEYGTCTPVK